MTIIRYLTAMRTRPVMAASTTFVAAVAMGFGGFAAVPHRGDPSTSIAEPPAAISFEGDDRLPSESAEDWVTYADFVVSATARSDEAEPIDETSRKRGEGIIGRHVTLSVDKVLWQRDAKATAPDDINWAASGWAFTETDGKRVQRPMLEVGTSRVEVGHSYIISITWNEARCSSGPDKEEPSWGGLGADSIIAADGGVVGDGEYEGKTRTASEAAAALHEGEAEIKFGAQMLGQSLDDVARALRDAKSQVRSESFAIEPVCD